MGVSETESCRSIDSWAREKATDIITPRVSPQLEALKIHCLSTKPHIYQTACSGFMRPPPGSNNVYKHE